MVQEQPGNVVISILGCKMQWGPAIFICQVGISTVCQEQGTEVRLLVLGGDEEWCTARGCLTVYFNLTGQQQSHLFQAAPGH